MQKLGPHSRSTSLARVDTRTREGRLLRDLRAELTAHVGGSPSVTQRLLIEQALELKLRIELMNQKTAGELPTLHDRNYYISWTHALTRTLAALGLEPAQPRKRTKTLEDIWQEDSR